MPEPLPGDLARALAAGAARLGPWAGRVTYRRVVSSTNDVARELAAAGAADGTTVVAGEQTAGRGRQGPPLVLRRGRRAVLLPSCCGAATRR